MDKRDFWSNAVKYISLIFIIIAFTLTGYLIGLWTKAAIVVPSATKTPEPIPYQFGPTVSPPVKPKTIPKPVIKKTSSPTPTQTVSTDNSGSSYNNSNSNSNNGGGASSNGS